MNELQQLVQARQRAAQAGSEVLLASIVRTSGSTYRKSGASMLITQDADHQGTISGGCLESELLETSWDRLKQNGFRPLLMRYDARLETDILWGTGSGCGGMVEILLERLLDDSSDPLLFLKECQDERRCGAIATCLGTDPSGIDRQPDPFLGKRTMLCDDGRSVTSCQEPQIDHELLSALRTVLLTGTSSYLTLPLSPAHSPPIPPGRDAGTRAESRLTFLLQFYPVAPALFLFGTWRDTIPLVTLAKELGWFVTVSGKRTVHGGGDRLKNLADRWIPLEQAVASVDGSSLVMIMTHDYLTDLALLRDLLPKRPLYTGLLGPRARRDRLLNEITGTDANLEDVLFAPAGLDVGAREPGEIALAIISEMLAVVRRRNAQSLRLREGSISSE
jgi:xanthine dehydrogenase accessory factor